MADEQNTSILLPIDIEAEMRKSYLDYAMTVIIARALPDVRDGLKPVQRRILFGHVRSGPDFQPRLPQVRENRRRSPRQLSPARRSRFIDALVRRRRTSTCAIRWSTARETSARWTAILPAAMRYTEARLAKIAEDTSGRHGKRDCRFHSQLRRDPTKNRWSAYAHSESSGQRRQRHRSGHGDQHSAAQFARSGGSGDLLIEKPDTTADAKF